MTVDMLAAAFIWPEEMLIGRTRTADDLDLGAPNEPESAAEPVARGDAAPFWAAVLRRFRADPPAPIAEPR